MTEPSQQNLPSSQKDINQWNFFIHLSQLSGIIVPLCNIIVPLVLWQMKRDEWPAVDAHTKAVVNWQISLLIYAVIGAILVIFLVGFLVLAALGLAFIVFSIIGAIKAQEGEVFKYPLTIEFWK